MASGTMQVRGLTVEAYNVTFTFDNSQVSAGVSRANINGGNNHIANAKALFCYTPGNFAIVTTDSSRANVAVRITTAYTGTIVVSVGCVY